MSFAPDMIEMMARARADLQMGVPVLIDGIEPLLLLAAETIKPARLAQVQSLNSQLRADGKSGAILVITAHRAGVLKVPAYDGDIARIALPQDSDIPWITAIANPADDLLSPMKGPLFPIFRYNTMLLLSSSAITPLISSPKENAQRFEHVRWRRTPRSGGRCG